MKRLSSGIAKILILLSISMLAIKSFAAAPEFGDFVGLPVQTRLDHKWKSITPPTAAEQRGWRDRFSSNVTFDVLEQLNLWANTHIQFKSEAGDNWQSLGESMTRGAGDCEDIAIAKYYILKSLGVPEEDLFLVVGKDQVARGDHAMLLVHLGNENYVLDNFISSVLPAEQFLAAVLPEFAFSGSSSWLFAKRVHRF